MKMSRSASKKLALWIFIGVAWLWISFLLVHNPTVTVPILFAWIFSYPLMGLWFTPDLERRWPLWLMFLISTPFIKEPALVLYVFAITIALGVVGVVGGERGEPCTHE